ncbi:hypothetical protein BGZ47_010308 [Haplosporangium gracile]|nr:hypothetical protein BGZ47_010308 [Haplosporangium gracile]
MSDSIGHDATPHPRDTTHNDPANDSGSDSDDVSTPPFLSRPYSRQSNSNSPTAVGADSATATTTAPQPREAFRSSVFGAHTRTKESKSSKSKHASGIASNSENSDSDNSDNEETGAGDREGRKSSRRRRFSDSASHLLAQAPSVPDLRFDNNYRKALNQIYETYAKESALAIDSTTILDASDEKNPTPSATGTLQKPSKDTTGKRVPSIPARVTVMTIRDIIIMPFIHGFFWGFGTILLTLVGQRSLVYHVQRTWRKVFGGNPDDVVNAPRGQPARVRRIGGGGGFGLGGVGLSNAGSAGGIGAGGFARPGHVY